MLFNDGIGLEGHSTYETSFYTVFFNGHHFLDMLLVFSGLSNLTSLSFKKSSAITAQGMIAFANLVNLVNLDLERCAGIHGGLIHIKGLFCTF